MLKYLSLVFVFFIQSCNSLDGELHIFKSYSLINQKNEEVLLDSGAVPAVLELKSSRLFTISVGSDTFHFKIPSDQVLPEEEGEIRLTSKDVGQNFGIYGRISSKLFLGELIRDQESCSWVERYYDCDERQVCQIRYRTVLGTKEVSYRNNIHQKNVVLNLNIDESGEVVSQLLGKKIFIKKVYRYESSCY